MSPRLVSPVAITRAIRAALLGRTVGSGCSIPLRVSPFSVRAALESAARCWVWPWRPCTVVVPPPRLHSLVCIPIFRGDATLPDRVGCLPAHALPSSPGPCRYPPRLGLDAEIPYGRHLPSFRWQREMKRVVLRRGDRSSVLTLQGVPTSCQMVVSEVAMTRRCVRSGGPAVGSFDADLCSCYGGKAFWHLWRRVCVCVVSAGVRAFFSKCSQFGGCGGVWCSGGLSCCRGQASCVAPSPSDLQVAPGLVTVLAIAGRHGAATYISGD